MARFFSFLIILFSAKPITPPLNFNFVVWQVGQGSWASLITAKDCIHFDMGGEEYPQKVETFCRKKNNWLLLTHEDWDHVSHIYRFRKSANTFCLHYPHHKRRKWLDAIATCPSLPEGIQVISKGQPGLGSNMESLVYLIRNQVLISGDAPRKMEKLWAHKVPKGLRVFVLGHHGSHTSNSRVLLSRMRGVMAVASARKSRYGHPHRKVVERLRGVGMPLLETEVWGNLYFRVD